MATFEIPTDPVSRRRGRPRKLGDAIVAPAIDPVVAPSKAAEQFPAAGPVPAKTVAAPVPAPQVEAARSIETVRPIETAEPVGTANHVETAEPVEIAKPAEAFEPVEAEPAPAPVPAPVATSPIPVPATIATLKPVSEEGPHMATAFAPTSFPARPEGLQAMFTDLQSRAKASVEKSTKLAEEMGEFAKGNVEAVMTSGRIAARGAETLGQEAVEYGKKSFEGAAAAFKTMVAAKSPTELFKLQSDYARASFDAAVTEGSKLSEAWLKLVGEIAQPLSSRVALAADKIKSPVA